MEITLNLDESLLNEALQLTNLTTQEELVNFALQELVRSRSGSSEVSRCKKNESTFDKFHSQYARDALFSLLPNSVNKRIVPINELTELT